MTTRKCCFLTPTFESYLDTRQDRIMPSQDPNLQGGSITDMAAQGTKVPDDAATQNTIPSVPRPDQRTDSSNDPNDLGATDLAGVANNAQDVSRVRATSLPPFQMYL